MRIAAAVVVLAVATAACGGAAAPGTTADPRLGPAEEYAFSARRALEGTRFEGSADSAVAGWVLEVCDELPGASDPDAAVAGVLEGIDAPAGAESDDRIMAVVLAEGAIAVCSDAVDAAVVRAWEAADAEIRFLEAVDSVSPVTERTFTADELLDAGATVCRVLDGGGTVEAALVAELEGLFGVAGPIEEISPDDVGDREGMVAGGVLGAASSILCPQHRAAVDEYLRWLARQDG